MISTNTITPLEIAALNAYDFAVGLGVMGLIQDLVKQGDEAKIGMSDRSLPDEVRAEAIRSGRGANQQLTIVAAAQAAIGITA